MWIKTYNGDLVDTSKMYKITVEEKPYADIKIYGHFDCDDEKILIEKIVRVSDKTPKALTKYIEELAKKLGAEEV